MKCQQILEQVQGLFMQFGVRSLTMDDIARHLSISKKTLYQCVSDKAELVERIMLSYLDNDIAQMEKIHADADNAIDEMFLIAQHVTQNLTNMHPSVLYDLEKYYPKAHKMFIDYKMKTIRGFLSRNMNDGIAQGMYRENLNVDIISGLYVGRMDVCFDQALFPNGQFNPTQIYIETIRYHIRGIASEKGIVYLQEKFKTLNQQQTIF
jgi:AcrR family transcriptional regulator